MADHLSTGGLWVEGLPDHAPEGAPAGVMAIAAVFFLRGFGKEGGGYPGAEAGFELAKGEVAHLADSLGGAGTHRSEGGVEGWEKRRVAHGQY